MLAGDRGRAGGVRIVDSFSKARRAAEDLLGHRLKTPQTGPEGELVKRVYVEQSYPIRREIYLGAVIDRARARVTLIAATEGGSDIEEIARRSPESLHRVAVDPFDGLQTGQARDLAAAVGLTGAQGEQTADIMLAVYRAFTELDASLVEINPLVITESGGIPIPTSAGIALPVIVGEKGCYWCRLRVRGTPGHGSRPYRTDNALVKAAAVVARLDAHVPETMIHDTFERFVDALGLPDELRQQLRTPDGLREALGALPVGMAWRCMNCFEKALEPSS